MRSPKRDDLAAYLRKRGIGTLIHYPVPIHLQPAYARLGWGIGSLPDTEKAAAQVLSLPMYPELRTTEVEAVAEAVLAWQKRSSVSI